MNNDAAGAGPALSEELGPIQPAATLGSDGHPRHLQHAWGVKEARLYGPPKLLYALTDDEVRILNNAKKDAAWRARRLDLCKCDHTEYCRHCYPAEFRAGGVWHGA